MNDQLENDIRDLITQSIQDNPEFEGKSTEEVTQSITQTLKQVSTSDQDAQSAVDMLDSLASEQSTPGNEALRSEAIATLERYTDANPGEARSSTSAYTNANTDPIAPPARTLTPDQTATQSALDARLSQLMDIQPSTPAVLKEMKEIGNQLRALD